MTSDIARRPSTPHGLSDAILRSWRFGRLRFFRSSKFGKNAVGQIAKSARSRRFTGKPYWLLHAVEPVHRRLGPVLHPRLGQLHERRHEVEHLPALVAPESAEHEVGEVAADASLVLRPDAD